MEADSASIDTTCRYQSIVVEGGRTLTGCNEEGAYSHLPRLPPQPKSAFSPLDLQIVTSFFSFPHFTCHLVYSQRHDMAHLGKPSLLSRLFPQEEQPADHFPSSEDWTSSTLLGRTSTPGRLSAPFTSSSSRDEQIHRLNDLFRTSFASLSSDAVPGTTHKDETVGGDVLAKLRGMLSIKPPLSAMAKT